MKYEDINQILINNNIKVIEFKENNGYKNITIDTKHLNDNTWEQDVVAKFVEDLCNKLPWKTTGKISGQRGKQVTITFRGNKKYNYGFI
jgi:hypothetical protein